jgi:Putative Actinobacterial Holin-X, holin superfamily III
MRPTLELLLDLVRQGRELMQIELSLARAELSERGRTIPASLTAVIAGLVLLPAGLGLILVALSLSLVRFGVPLDLAFLIVAVVVIGVGLVSLLLGLRGLKPSKLLPARSISQISSLIGGR